jgi:hypothetical protein
MRKLAWPVVTLVLIAVSFVVGRKTGGFRPLPAIAATLPGDETEFNRELDERIRERFPIGANEETLIIYLTGEGFAPEWRRREESNASAFVWNGLICTKIMRVFWRADASGVLMQVNGSYESHCL